MFRKRKKAADPVLEELTEALCEARKNWEHTCAAFDELTDPALAPDAIREALKKLS